MALLTPVMCWWPPIPYAAMRPRGDSGAFGSRKIEYDIIHVCRKRIATPEPVSWSRMRRWVKDETIRLKELLEHTHGKTLPESDLRVILRGKSLEFYSRHYGQVLVVTDKSWKCAMLFWVSTSFWTTCWKTLSRPVVTPTRERRTYKSPLFALIQTTH